jgi:hypothetical protein
MDERKNPEKPVIGREKRNRTDKEESGKGCGRITPKGRKNLFQQKRTRTERP